MSLDIENWRTQIRKGYLELCLLQLIAINKKLYGLHLLEELAKLGLSTKEGTLYPILNRLSTEGLLSSFWETESAKGHPRKFYSLTKEGQKILSQMEIEFGDMVKIYTNLKN